MTLTAIITTIQPPTDQVRGLLKFLEPLNAQLVVAGDSKGPETFDLPGVLFLSLDEQKRSSWQLASLLGEAHYARKNIAYLTAIALGARILYETDDDTVPTARWSPSTEHITADQIQHKRERCQYL